MVQKLNIALIGKSTVFISFSENLDHWLKVRAGKRRESASGSEL